MLWVPAYKQSPTFLSIGLDSPVNNDSSTALSDSNKIPSAGIISPGETRSTSPGWQLTTGTTSIVFKSGYAKVRSQVAGNCFAKASAPPWASCRANNST